MASSAKLSLRKIVIRKKDASKKVKISTFFYKLVTSCISSTAYMPPYEPSASEILPFLSAGLHHFLCGWDLPAFQCPNGRAKQDKIETGVVLESTGYLRHDG